MGPFKDVGIPESEGHEADGQHKKRCGSPNEMPPQRKSWFHCVCVLDCKGR